MPARALISTAYTFDAASNTTSRTIPADCDVLEVSVVTISSGQDQTSVTCGGQAMTKIGTGLVHSGGKPRVNVWRLISPPTGAQNIIVTNAAADKTGVAVFSWTDTDTTTPFDGWATAQGLSTTPSRTVTSATGDRVADTTAGLSITALTPGAGQTELVDFMPTDGRMGCSHEDGAASVTMSWTIGESKEWVIAGWNANPPAGGGTETTDSATVPLDLQASGTELAERVDLATIPLDLVASGIENAQFADAATIVLTLTPSGVEFQTPTETGIGRVGLMDGDEPETRTDHVLRVIASVANGAHSGVLRFQLYELTIAIGAEFETTTLTDTATEYTFGIPDVDAEDIVDYADLEVEFYGHSASGDPMEFRIHEIELEIPAAAPTDKIDSATVYLSLTPASEDTAQFVDQATVSLDLQAITTDEERQQYDAATILLDLQASGTDVADVVEATIVPLDLQASGIEARESTDAGTVLIDLQASGTDEAQVVDAQTIYVELQAITTDEERQQYDANTVLVDIQITTVESADYADAETTYLDIQASGVDEQSGSTEDTGTAYLDLQSSGVELLDATEAETVPLQLDASGTDFADLVDTAIVSFDLIASGSDLEEFVDAAQLYLDLQASGIDEYTAGGAGFTDEATVYVDLLAASTDIQESSDAETAYLDLQSSGAEFAEFVDSGSIYLDVIIQSVEEYGRVDEATIYLDLLPDSQDILDASDLATATLQLTPTSVEFAEFFDAATVPLGLTAGSITAHEDMQTVYLKLSPAAAAIVLAVFSGTMLSRRYEATFDRRWKGEHFRRWLR